VFQLADQIFNLAGTNLGLQVRPRRFVAKSTLGCFEPCDRRLLISFKQADRLFKHLGETEESFGLL
jgi:hypothetical protein